MGFNAKNVQVYVWGLMKFAMEISCIFVAKFPCFSCVLLVIFLMYMIFPSLFWVLMYSLPFVVFVTTVLGIYFSPLNVKESNSVIEKKNDGKSSAEIRVPKADNRNPKHRIYSCMHARSVRKRKPQEIVKEDKEDETRANAKDETTPSASSDLVDTSTLEEESPKEIREVEIDHSRNNSSSLRSNFRASSLEGSPKFGSCGKGDKMDVKHSEDKEEDGQNVVQWTTDDQKNHLMDLGISEMERNKRLENLIARRRARKLLSLQVRSTCTDMGSNEPASQLPLIIIPRNNPFLPDSTNSPHSPVPGSAPSVLLPMQNPFDLPYDPQEEKPDLRGDSFNQEFMSAQQREIMLCRHESFTLGAKYPGELKQERLQSPWYHEFSATQRTPGGLECLKKACKLDGEFIRNVESEPCQLTENKLNDDIEFDQIKEVIHVSEREADKPHEEESSHQADLKPIPNGSFTKRLRSSSSSSSSSSSEDDEQFYKIDKDVILKTLACPAPKITPVNRGEDYLRPIERFTPLSRSDERFYYTRRAIRHTPTHSIASDLLVEVSDVSSPSLTVDENVSFQDDDTSMHNEDMEKVIRNNSQEDLWIASCPVVDETESRPNGHELNKKTSEDSELSRISNPGCPTSSNMLTEEEPSYARELDTTYNASGTVVPLGETIENLSMKEDSGTEGYISSKQEDYNNLKKQSEITDNSRGTQESILDIKQMNENVPFSPENCDSTDVSLQIDGDQNAAEVGVLGTDHSFDEAEPSVLLPSMGTTESSILKKQSETTDNSGGSPESIIQIEQMNKKILVSLENYESTNVTWHIDGDLHTEDVGVLGKDRGFIEAKPSVLLPSMVIDETFLSKKQSETSNNTGGSQESIADIEQFNKKIPVSLENCVSVDVNSLINGDNSAAEIGSNETKPSFSLPSMVREETSTLEKQSETTDKSGKSQESIVQIEQTHKNIPISVENGESIISISHIDGEPNAVEVGVSGTDHGLDKSKPSVLFPSTATEDTSMLEKKSEATDKSQGDQQSIVQIEQMNKNVPISFENYESINASLRIDGERNAAEFGVSGRDHGSNEAKPSDSFPSTVTEETSTSVLSIPPKSVQRGNILPDQSSSSGTHQENSLDFSQIHTNLVETGMSDGARTGTFTTTEPESSGHLMEVLTLDPSNMIQDMPNLPKLPTAETPTEFMIKSTIHENGAEKIETHEIIQISDNHDVASESFKQREYDPSLNRGLKESNLKTPTAQKNEMTGLDSSFVQEDVNQEALKHEHNLDGVAERKDGMKAESNEDQDIQSSSSSVKTNEDGKLAEQQILCQPTMPEVEEKPEEMTFNGGISVQENDETGQIPLEVLEEKIELLENPVS